MTCKTLTSHRQPVPSSNRSAVEVPPSPSADGLATADTVLRTRFPGGPIGPWFVSSPPPGRHALCGAEERATASPACCSGIVTVGVRHTVRGRHPSPGHCMGVPGIRRAAMQGSVTARLESCISVGCLDMPEPSWRPVWGQVGLCHMVVGFTTQTGMHGRLAHPVTSVSGRACSVHRGILQVLRNPRSGGASVGPVEGGE
ncbi:hypothetical protein OIDMADRAFT_24485 [Oidiodendron maius Zn]|uniref:Uncharacterized protein n=1 Tax=Oidiodendron maius (strain Zn) TaxID=913774 RepID=A0A0C3HD37_OIDMZ|nr:hypothetical protein OIDMADRAFT_24485 [Oidiodendron maius Zn]